MLMQQQLDSMHIHKHWTCCTDCKQNITESKQSIIDTVISVHGSDHNQESQSLPLSCHANTLTYQVPQKLTALSADGVLLRHCSRSTVSMHSASSSCHNHCIILIVVTVVLHMAEVIPHTHARHSCGG